MAVQSERGFTLLEMLVVTLFIGLLAAIAAPGWINFLEGNRLTSATNELYGAIRKAQSEARHRGGDWQFSVRERDDRVEWTTHAKSVSFDEVQWQPLEFSSLQIDEETTFASSGDVYYVRFDDDGNVQYRLGRVTLSSERASNIKRCVIVSTIVGAMRKSRDQPTERDGKFCY